MKLMNTIPKNTNRKHNRILFIPQLDCLNRSLSANNIPMILPKGIPKRAIYTNGFFKIKTTHGTLLRLPWLPKNSNKRHRISPDRVENIKLKIKIAIPFRIN